MTNGKTCPHCGLPLRFLGKEEFQLGKTGWILGDLPNLWAGAREMELWYCPGCGKLEFYLPEEEREELSGDDRMARIRCPACGTEHDLDDPKCPRCGAENPNF